MDATGIMNLQENDTSVSLSYRRSCVLGSYYQGDTRVGLTAGMGCACMSPTALCWLVVCSVVTWKTFDLDQI